MNMSHFKKVSQSADHSILRHPAGHEIKILHSKLNKQELKKLKSLPLAEGGEVLEGPNTRPMPDEAKTMFDRQLRNDANEKEHYGSQTHEDVAPGTPKLKAGQRVRLADGGTPEEPMDEAESAPTAPPVPQAQSAGPQLPVGPDFSQELQRDIAMQRQGIQNQAAAQGQLGQAQAQQYGQAAGSLENLQSIFGSRARDINDERMAAYEDYKKGRINPNAYWDEKSPLHPENEGHSKVATAIGLMFSGLGGVQSAQAAVGFLNQQINRNIEAQKANMGKKENMMTFLTQQLGNEKDAAAMSSILQRDALADRIAQEAARAQSPVAKAQAMQQVGALQAQNAPILAQLQYRQGIIKGMQKGALPPEAGVQVLVDPSHQSKVYDSLGKVRALNTMENEMNKNAAILQQKILNGTFSPNDTKAMKQQFSGPLAKVAAGRFNKEEAELQMDILLPSKTDTPSTAAHKDQLRQEFFRALRAEHEPVLVGNHIPVPKPAARASSRSYRAGSNK